MSSLQTVNPTEIIEEIREDISPFLASSGQSYDRLRTVFMIAMQQNPELLRCTKESIQREITKCAADGLVPDAKEAVLLHYNDAKQGLIANYQPMVHGIIKRIKELGGVFSITCNLVYEHDRYEENEADIESLVHMSPGFGKLRGAIVGGYVIFRDENRRVMHFEKMTMEDFDRVRKASKSPDSPAWKKWPEEMYRKALVRRGAKYIAINNDRIRQLIERTDEFYDFKQQRVIERVDPFTGKVVEDQVNAPAALSHQPGQTVPITEQVHKPEPVTNQTRQSDKKQQKRQEPTPARQTKPVADLPDTPPSIPDIAINDADREQVIEGCTKILAVSLDMELDPRDRRVALKQAAAIWREAAAPYTHPLLKSCIDMSDWAIRRDADGQAWTAEHTIFVHKLKTLLGVDEIAVGKYP